MTCSKDSHAGIAGMEGIGGREEEWYRRAQVKVKRSRHREMGYNNRDKNKRRDTEREEMR